MKRQTGVELMIRILMSVAAISMVAVQPVAAKTLAPGCNPAVQNWVNGSQDTCPYASNSTVLVVQERSPPPTIPETPVEVEEEVLD
jgi:hypothetical protein